MQLLIDAGNCNHISKRCPGAQAAKQYLFSCGGVILYHHIYLLDLSGNVMVSDITMIFNLKDEGNFVLEILPRTNSKLFHLSMLTAQRVLHYDYDMDRKIWTFNS